MGVASSVPLTDPSLECGHPLSCPPRRDCQDEAAELVVVPPLLLGRVPPPPPAGSSSPSNSLAGALDPHEEDGEGV